MYSEYLLKKLRQREGLEEDDKSKDSELQKLTPFEALDHWLEWEGIHGYTYSIVDVISEVYGIELRR